MASGAYSMMRGDEAEQENMRAGGSRAWAIVGVSCICRSDPAAQESAREPLEFFLARMQCVFQYYIAWFSRSICWLSVADWLATLLRPWLSMLGEEFQRPAAMVLSGE
jgi:hypothetical protein